MGKDKKEKKKKKEKGGKSGAATTSPVVTDRHVWTEALAIQTLMRRVEAEALDRYITRPDLFELIRDRLVELLEGLREDPLFGCGGRRPCPPGYYCCDSVCRPEPCEVGPNPPPPPKPPTRLDP